MGKLKHFGSTEQLFHAIQTRKIEEVIIALEKDEAGQIMSKRDGSTSLQQRQESGTTAEEVIGVLAFSLGLIDRKEAVSARELQQTLSLAHLQQALERLAQKGQSSVS